MKLGEIADIRTGLILARKKANVKYEIQKRYKLVTLKTIEDEGVFNEEPFEIFESKDELSEEYFTREGDILIKLSANFTTVCIDGKTAGLLVPSYFSIIRLKTKEYIPEYITWYLNSDKVKRELIKSQRGSIISSTNNTILSSIHIKAIPIEEQKRISKVRELYLKERNLLEALIKEKEKYYKAITYSLINKYGEE